MTTVHIRQSTTLSFNRLVASLINFDPGRREIFANGHGHWSWSTSAATPGRT